MAIGDRMPEIPGMITTFSDDFSSGLAKFPNTKYPWSRETNINGEFQYYPDQSLLQSADKTVFIDSDTNLTLRCMPTPSYLQGSAKIVLNGYVIQQQISATQLLLQGENYWDRNNFQNATGIGWAPDSIGTCQFPGVAEQAYSSIVPSGSGFIITLADGIPNNISLNNTNYRLNIFRRQPYISGMVTTQNTQANGQSGFSQKFGRFMVRVKAPRGQFCFPAAWLWRDYEEAGIIYQNKQKSIEADIWEILGHAPDISYHTLHSPGFSMRPGDVPLLGSYQGVEQWKTASMQQFQRINAARDYSSDFFWVALDHFTDNSCSWYVEDRPNSGIMVEVANSLMSPLADDGIIDPAMLILNNAFLSDWAWNQSKLYDMNYSRFVGQTAPPYDYKISDVLIQQFPGEQTPGVSINTDKVYTRETVVGPVGTIDDVVVCLPTHETDRQGTVHEIELKLAYRPVNIKREDIALKWSITASAPLEPVFVDGNDQSWKARVYLTTSDSSPLPESYDFKVNIDSVTLK